MPEFRYVVADREGRQRSGSLMANSREEAEQMVKSRGLRVIELTPKVDLASIDFTLKPSVSPQRVGKIVVSTPAARPARRRGPTSFSRRGIERVSDRALLVGLALALVVLYLALRGSAPRAPKNGTLAAVRFHCLGTVRLPVGMSSEGTSLVLEVPQLSFRKTYGWSELSHPSSSSFDCAVDLKLRRSPAYFVCHAVHAGCRPAAARLATPATDGTATLSTLTLAAQ